MSWRAPKRIQIYQANPTPTPADSNPAEATCSSTPTSDLMNTTDAGITAENAALAESPLHHSEPHISPQPHHNSAETTSSSTPTTETIQPLHHSQPHVLPQLEQHQPMKKKGTTRMKQPCTVPGCDGLYANLWNHIFQTHKAQGKYSSELLCVCM